MTTRRGDWMIDRARVVARLAAVLTAVGLVLSGPGMAAAAQPDRADRSPDRTFGPSWIISGGGAAADDDADEAPPASVSSAWPKGRVSGDGDAEEVFGLLLAEAPSEHAEKHIPGVMRRLYVDAAAGCEGLPWSVLAGMAEVASDHGREIGDRRELASGPLRFPLPLWRDHGVDGDGDGKARRLVAADSLASAAAYLCTEAAAADADPDADVDADADADADAAAALDLDLLREAVARFFADADEVEPVLAAALSYVDAEVAVEDELVAADPSPAPAPAPAAPAPAAPASVEPATPTRQMPTADIETLLSNPNITWTDRERNDIRAGLIDGRVIGLLGALARDHEITVVVLKSGHSRYIAGTNRDSHHYHGRGVDITYIDGEKVSASSKKAYALAQWLDALPDSLRPSEVGSPFPSLESRPGHFTDSMHTGHLHIAWRAR